MIAHTLGNPFDLNAVTAFAREHNLWLIEDCCDAVGLDLPAGRTSARSATWPPSASTRRTTSRWAKGGRPDRSASAENPRRIVPRLGPRLLVCPRDG